MDTRGLVRKSTVSTPSISSNATAFAANSRRSSWNIQNLGTNTLYLLLGSGATTEVFNYALKAGSVPDDGTGGSYGESSGVIYVGIITIAGTAARYTTKETS